MFIESDDFDAPVYRSFDMVFSSGGCSPTGAAVDDDLEFSPPIYRSVSLEAEASEESRGPMSVEEAQRLWLATMPPMIHRQNARGASLALDRKQPIVQTYGFLHDPSRFGSVCHAMPRCTEHWPTAGLSTARRVCVRG